jgi:cullin-associated NEDD8-dissociated protein 1
LAACGALFSELFSSLSKEQTSRLQNLLLERLKNETTRIAAIKTLSAIAGASSALNLSPILGESIETMAGFLKLQSRSLKQSALQALDTVLTHHGAEDSHELYGLVLQELAPLVVDSDLHISHLAM